MGCCPGEYVNKWLLICRHKIRLIKVILIYLSSDITEFLTPDLSNLLRYKRNEKLSDFFMMISMVLFLYLIYAIGCWSSYYFWITKTIFICEKPCDAIRDVEISWTPFNLSEQWYFDSKIIVH